MTAHSQFAIACCRICALAKTNFKTVQEYIASKAGASQAALKRVRSAIRKAIPAAEEAISYQIPVYKLNGVPVIYFAGWKEHFSIYPANQPLVAAFEADLARYKISKGTIRFPLSEPVPADLIERIARFRVTQLAARDKGKGSGQGGAAQLTKRPGAT